ncbi:MAG TPA: sigma-70 family RNA polymerase sigma factor [Solirubrobacteraceae bacterium]|jgi:RNA polymerase sigma factor (sigma-70 family)|nr:sigma-70 family RNA polymerase sigma factor [Solirubrobacteraceae bacterium]
MEASALTKTQLSGLRGPSPLLRLAPDERLIALVRRGQTAAFEAIVARYQTRLLAFCRHLLPSREDAEDVLQEVFAAAFNAMVADRREINLRPWLYRIARNRCLNHLRRQTAIGVDSMDVHFADGGASTVEKVAGRENFRLLMSDIRRLPETQRTALLLREMDALSYEQIAEAMETTTPGVKSLLVRARISLGEAAEARKLTCAEVRLELGAIAEGISSASPAIRRHVKDCDRCHAFRAHLRANNRAMAAMLPIGPLLLLKKFALAKFGLSVSAGGASATAGSGGAAAASGAAGATGAAGAAGVAGVASAGAGGSAAGAITAGALATKAVAGLAAAALVTAGAVEVHHPRRIRPSKPAITQQQIAAAPVQVSAPRVVVSAAQPTTTETGDTGGTEAGLPTAAELAAAKARLKTTIATTPAIPIAPPVSLTPVVAAPTGPTGATAPAVPTTTQQVSSVSALPPQPGTTGAQGPPASAVQTTPTGQPIQPAQGTTPPAAQPTQPTQPVTTQPVTSAGSPPTTAPSIPSTGTTAPAEPTVLQVPTDSTPGAGTAGSAASTTTEILGGAVVTTPSRHSVRPGSRRAGSSSASRTGHQRRSGTEAEAPKRTLEHVGRSHLVR